MKIIQDLEAFSKGRTSKKIVTIITNPCFHAVCLFRLSSLMNKIKMYPIAKLIWYINRVIYSVDIDYRANIAGGFVLVHGIGVVIGKGVISEGKLTVYQNCTIGGDRGKTKKIKNQVTSQPYLEKNVKICPGASIYGPVMVGENTVVKAGSIVSLSSDNSMFFAKLDNIKTKE